MNWNLSPIRFSFSHYNIPSLLFSSVLVAGLLSLSSCDPASWGRAKFKPESMHWLQFRGPNASGIAPDNADPPVHFSADTNLLWKTEMLPGWSSPCIVDEKIFLTGFDDSDSLLYTIAVNRENGDILWKDSVKPHAYYNMHPINSYANPTIASDGERIYSSFPGYGLTAYDLNGNKLWEFSHEALKKFYGGSCSPVIIDSIVIIIINSKQDPRMVAVNCQTGDSVWTIRAGDYDWASFNITATPVLWNNLLILHFSRSIVAYDIVKGIPAWWLFVQTIGAATPVIMDDKLFINHWIHLGEEKVRGSVLPFPDMVNKLDANGNGLIEQGEIHDEMMLFHRPESPDAPSSKMHLNADRILEWYDEDKNGAFDQDEWKLLLEDIAPYSQDHGMIAISLQGEGERPLTDIIWKVNEDTPETPSPLVVYESILFIKNGGIMTVINRESGEVVHKERIGAAGSYLSSPMLAGNRIYTCSHNGTVTVLSAVDFSVLAHNKLRGKIGASPVAVDEVLYVRTNKHLYAFREQ